MSANLRLILRGVTSANYFLITIMCIITGHTEFYHLYLPDVYHFCNTEVHRLYDTNRCSF